MNNLIKLIVGLGNPGASYEKTRHNAGSNFVLALARSKNIELKPEGKFFGATGRLSTGNNDIRLLNPSTFMNRSGNSVSALAAYYKILPSQILIAHDELDLSAGVAKYKIGGGHGGHNGLRDVIDKLSNDRSFARLRIGIDHPGNAIQVSSYVLQKPSPQQQVLIDRSIENAIRWLHLVIKGDWDKAMTGLHSEIFPLNQSSKNGL